VTSIAVKLLLVGAGGAIGAVSRYLVAGWFQRLVETFPLGTLAVNILGCILIGVLGGVFVGPGALREGYRLFLLVGLLGGFTTFSTFSAETMALLVDRQWLWASANVVLSTGACLAAAWAGLRLHEWMYGV
jgi:CrcB protein